MTASECRELTLDSYKDKLDRCLEFINSEIRSASLDGRFVTSLPLHEANDFIWISYEDSFDIFEESMSTSTPVITQYIPTQLAKDICEDLKNRGFEVLLYKPKTLVIKWSK